MSFSPNSTQYSYYKDPTYIGVTYDRLFFAYTIVVGGLSAIGNLYIILLFTQFSKLRSVLCNWLIVYLCVPDVLIGIACVYQSIIKIVVMDNNIVGFSFVLCNVLQIPYGLGYRIGQTIACMMAFDRLIAIWKPIFYARWQSNVQTLALANGIFIILDFAFLVFLHAYGIDASIPLPLSNCFRPNGILFYQVIPTYSGVISILFVVVYIFSLALFSKQAAERKKTNSTNSKQISKMQLKIFISVSLALLCYSVFYVIPTIAMMLTYYFNLPSFILNIYGYTVAFGAELNGCLNAAIYLLKHQEFKECSMKFLYRLLGKTTHVNAMSQHISKITVVRPKNQTLTA